MLLIARPTSVIDYAGKLIRQRLAVIRTQHADPVSPGGESTCAHMISHKSVAYTPCRKRRLPSDMALPFHQGTYVEYIRTRA